MMCLVHVMAQTKETVTFNQGARLTIYNPAESAGVGIVMCPGGGYDHLAVTHEGHDMAGWMNSLGITYAVLEYRLPKGESLVPLTDAEEAIRILRRHMASGTGNGKVAQGQPVVGVMGGSAGGHLAASLATMHRTADSRPDFQILLYPVISLEKSITNSGTRTQLIGWDADDDVTNKFSPDKHVGKNTPMAFLVLSDDDTAVVPENSLRYYRALKQNGVQASLHIYPTGGHGWGFKDSFGYKRQWTGELEKWLRDFVVKTHRKAQAPSASVSGLLYPSFRGLLMCGYQAWFTCAGDATRQNWFHYNNGGVFAPGQCCIEYWPDMSEYKKTYPTPFVYPDGKPATIFSSDDDETFDLHFRWMKEYGIDGALFQRFKVSVEKRPWTKPQVGKAIEAAKRYNRAIIVEYDLSGLRAGASVQSIIDDWNSLCEEYGLNDPERCPNYVWENGKPVVGFFGAGLGGDTCEPEQYLEMFDKMLGAGNVAGAISPFVGCSYYWRTSGNDALSFNEWEPVYKRCAIISPWAVGRYANAGEFAQKRDNISGDLKWCRDNNIVYAPVAFPGFSWRNTKTIWKNGTPTFPKGYPYGQIPRRKGKFFKTQLDSYLSLGVDAIFVAMFDEVDEGTAIFKIAHRDRTPLNASDKNPNGRFLSIEDDLGTDHYLKIAGSAAAKLKK